MDEIKELELLIEEIDNQITAYLNSERSPEKVYKLSDELDRLIIKHCSLFE